LLEYAEANPNAVKFASAGLGTSTHMVGEALQADAGIQFNHVPFRGLSGAITALLGGHADIFVRRQGFWDNRRRELTEALVHQVCHIRPLHLDEASGAV